MTTYSGRLAAFARSSAFPCPWLALALGNFESLRRLYAGGLFLMVADRSEPRCASGPVPYG
jgi:hypothetical protein